MARISGSEIDKILSDDGFTETERNLITNGFFTAYQNKGTEENFKDYMKGYYLTRGLEATTQTDVVTVEAKTEINNNIDADKEKEGGEFNIMLISHPDILKNIDGGTYNTYASMMASSNFEYGNINDGTLEEYWNYIRKRGCKQVILDFMNEANKEFDGKVPAPRTIELHIKKMLENNIPLAKVENHNGKVYYRLLNHIGKGYFRLIPYEKVRELVISTKNNMLKLYVLMDYLCDEKSYKEITRKKIAEMLGLSINSSRELDNIGVMLNSLRKLGFIDIRQNIVINKAGKEVKKINSYRITTIEEYKEINKIKNVRKVNE